MPCRTPCEERLGACNGTKPDPSASLRISPRGSVLRLRWAKVEGPRKRLNLELFLMRSAGSYFRLVRYLLVLYLYYGFRRGVAGEHLQHVRAVVMVGGQGHLGVVAGFGVALQTLL